MAHAPPADTAPHLRVHRIPRTETASRLTRRLRMWGNQWQRFWMAPDPLLRDQGGSGEVVVAVIRFPVLAVLLAVPIVDLASHPDVYGAGLRLWIVFGALVLAAAAYVLARGSTHHAWLGFATSVADVTLVTALMVTYLIVDRPLFVVNSRVLFSVYFLAIAATTLRYDARICVLAGLLAIAQYAALVAYADLRWSLNHEVVAGAPNAPLDFTSHYARLAFLGCAAVMSTVGVLRSQHLRRLAAKDPLTGLINRGVFDELAAVEVQRTRRHDRPLALALIDVDHFKRFNDTYGHLVGDKVLRVTARLLGAVRGSDLVARYGGEEFIILFPETDAPAAVEKAERLRRSIEATNITVSIGVAGLPADGYDLRDVIDRADLRLYEAKRAGRNRVVGP